MSAYELLTATNNDPTLQSVVFLFPLPSTSALLSTQVPFVLPPLHAWSLMGGWSRSAVLELYRALLRAGRHLQYTDRNYYRRIVAREFRRCQALTAPKDKEDALKRGQFFLSSGLGGLM